MAQVPIAMRDSSELFLASVRKHSEQAEERNVPGT